MAGRMTYSRKEKRSQYSSYLFVDILELRFFYVELIDANFIHYVVLNEKNTVGKATNTA